MLVRLDHLDHDPRRDVSPDCGTAQYKGLSVGWRDGLQNKRTGRISKGKEARTGQRSVSNRAFLSSPLLGIYFLSQPISAILYYLALTQYCAPHKSVPPRRRPHMTKPLPYTPPPQPPPPPSYPIAPRPKPAPTHPSPAHSTQSNYDFHHQCYRSQHGEQWYKYGPP